MENTFDRKEIRKFSNGMLIGFIFMILTIPITKRVGPYGFIIPVIFMFLMILCSFKVEKIKKDKDIKTYEEILAYMEGREIPNTNKSESREKSLVKKVFLPLYQLL